MSYAPVVGRPRLTASGISLSQHTLTELTTTTVSDIPYLYGPSNFRLRLPFAVIALQSPAPRMVLVVKAVHTFVAEHGDELEFQAGELIEVLEKDDAFGDGWWRVSGDTQQAGRASLMSRVRTPGVRRGCSPRRISRRMCL